MWLKLSGGSSLGVLLIWLPCLLHSSVEQREQVAVGSRGLHWKNLDGDVSFNGLSVGGGDQTRTRKAAQPSIILFKDNHVNQLLQVSELIKAAPLPKLKKIDKDAGEVVSPLGLSFTWKVKGVDTGYAFAVYEMAIAPDASVPMHVHPFAEYFFVLEGSIDVMGLEADGTVEWTPLSKGESANAPMNAPHGIKNRSDQPAKFLSVANFQHEEAFNQIVAAMKTPEVEASTGQEQADLFMRLAGERQVYFVNSGRG